MTNNRKLSTIFLKSNYCKICCAQYVLIVIYIQQQISLYRLYHFVYWWRMNKHDYLKWIQSSKKVQTFIESVSFDESLNFNQQKCQMNVNIRYWDDEKNVTQAAYHDSRFLQRLNAVNLIEEILNAIKYLDTKKFLHLGLDEPSKK